jgi:hypothetical protein
MKLTRRLSSPTAILTIAASIGVVTVATNTAPALAISNPVTLNFVCASTTLPSSKYCPIGAQQFSAVVSPVGTNQALFSFQNNVVNPPVSGGATSSIIKIGISDKSQYSLGNRVSLTGYPTGSGGAVKFNSTPASPVGTIHNFTSTAGGSGATSAQRANGINQGESLDILFNIANAGFRKPFNAVVADLFRSGLSIQVTAAGFGGSEGQRKTQVIYNSKANAVPEPITLLGSGAALGFGALMKRRSSKLKAKKAGNMSVEPALEPVV